MSQMLHLKKYSESDHDFLWIMMNFNEIDKGPGVWILNTELLKMEMYRIGNRKHNY